MYAHSTTAGLGWGGVARPASSSASPEGLDRLERGWEPLDPVHEVRAELFGLAFCFDVGETPEELGHHHDDLAACEMRAQAEVRSARPEPALMIRLAGDVEAIGILEVRLVAVGRDVPHRDLGALEHLGAAERDVARERPAHMHDRAA